MQGKGLQRYTPLILRLGLGLVFLIFGLDKFRSEEVQLASWADWVPGWFSTLIGGQVKTFISVLGIFEVLVGLAFLTGYLLFWASLLSSLFLLATVLLSTSGPFFGQIDQSTIRDIGLLGGTISLTLSTAPTTR
ncbi:MAG: DoxX family membrane protein [candidate division NC10 bacterium]|nr:DoxX family membrane protein [candidate division NC10 bacterium]